MERLLWLCGLSCLGVFRGAAGHRHWPFGTLAEQRQGVYVGQRARGRVQNASHLRVFRFAYATCLPANASSFKIAASFTTLENHPFAVLIKAPPAASKDGPRINDDIRNAQIQLIDQTGDNKGTVETVVAIKMAQEAGMDLVEISPNTSPPVCKIMDYGKYKYSAQKKAAEARKRQKTVEIKEIKLRPMIDDHDYDVKMRAMQRFFEEGDKVKITLRYRGREMAHQEIGTKLLDKIKTDVAELAKVEQDARFEGRQVVMVLAPR
ncbi:translation initiation factor IF-3 [Bradyrhizobium diazoefficiens]